MDLSGPGIDVKLKERKKEATKEQERKYIFSNYKFVCFSFLTLHIFKPHNFLISNSF